MSSTLLTLATLFSLLPSLTSATPCVAFDATFNLYALTSQGDYSLGTQDAWASPSVSAKSVNPPTAAGRPDFSGTNTTCYLSQFLNAIYVVNADAADPTAVHIYNPTSNQWSKQEVAKGGPDPTNSVQILDHDTNVFYAVTADKGELYFLNMEDQTQANSTALSWTDVGAVPAAFFGKAAPPTIALAENHIHFLDLPGGKGGEAQIFVIHFSFFQPAVQSYTVAGKGANFPSAHGQTASFFKAQGVQQEFAFIPDDNSATYVVNVIANTTTAFPAPPAPKTPGTASYAASEAAFVQLDPSSGSISYMPWKTSATTGTWSTIKANGLPNFAVAEGGSTNSTASSNSGSGKGGPSTTGSGAAPSGTSGQNAAVGGAKVAIGAVTAGLMAAVAMWL